MIALLSGLAAGSVHVFSGPDHLAAVAPLSLARWRTAIKVGFNWGVGHSGGVMLIGLLALLLKEKLPLEALSHYAEQLVGLLLIGIGLWAFRKISRYHLHAHEHVHNGAAHVHFHAHQIGHGPTVEKAHQHTHAAFAIGTVHGIAGSSHFVAVLPSLMFATQTESLIYLASYSLGTVLAMVSFSVLLGLAGKRFQKHPRQFRWFSQGIAVAAVAIGTYWVVSAA